MFTFHLRLRNISENGETKKLFLVQVKYTYHYIILTKTYLPLYLPPFVKAPVVSSYRFDSCFGLRKDLLNSSIMSNRLERKRIAEETLQIIKEGSYCIPGGHRSGKDDAQCIREDIDRCDKLTNVLNLDCWEKMFEEIKLPDTLRKQRPAIEVTDEYSITCCRRLHEEGFKNITCLNFASAKNPCGGMLNGSIAQEESLGLCSALYSSLTKQEHHYTANRKDPKNGLYQDSLIYSPGCPVFRDDATYQLLNQPFKVNFISCPAVNSGITKAPTTLIKDTMRRRTKAIISIAIKEGSDGLVLGAWGTGVFKNDVNDVANYFKEWLIPSDAVDPFLHQASITFSNGSNASAAFKVVFAVGKDPKNQQAFRTAFTSSSS